MTLKWLEFFTRQFPGAPVTQSHPPAQSQSYAPLTKPSTLLLGEGNLPLLLVKNPRARRYILRLRPDGTVRVTIPRSGTIPEALAFASRQTAWIQQQLQRLPELPSRSCPWSAGERILYQGEWTPLEPVVIAQRMVIALGEHRISVRNGEANLRPSIEAFLWRQARNRLVPRVWEWEAYCQRQGLGTRRPLKQVTVRNQRSRWGSCSARGTVSLNWRLIQMPYFVQDYLILHELIHLREMNHASRFWQQVGKVCPAYATAEAWIKANASHLR